MEKVRKLSNSEIKFSPLEWPQYFIFNIAIYVTTTLMFIQILLSVSLVPLSTVFTASCRLTVACFLPVTLSIGHIKII